MKVILLQDVANLGKKGEIVEAAEGFGRNYLLPRKLAKEASAANINQAKKDQATAAHRAARAKDEAVVLGSQLEKTTVTIKVRLGEGGKMFGSVTSKDVAEALVRQTGLDLDRRKVELKEQIKAPGTYTALARLHKDVATTFTVVVTAD